MPSIENYSLCSYDIYFSAIENIQFLPGINLVSDVVLERLNENEAYKRYIELGIFQELITGVPDEKVDDRTNLLVTEKQGELVPVHETEINKTTTKGTQGKKFTIEECQKQNIPINLGSQIALKPPTKGWVDASHVIDALQIQDETLQKQVQNLFA